MKRRSILKAAVASVVGLFAVRTAEAAEVKTADEVGKGDNENQRRIFLHKPPKGGITELLVLANGVKVHFRPITETRGIFKAVEFNGTVESLSSIILRCDSVIEVTDGMDVREHGFPWVPPQQVTNKVGVCGTYTEHHIDVSYPQNGGSVRWNLCQTPTGREYAKTGWI